MSSFQCGICHTDITEGDDGRYATYCKHYPLEDRRKEPKKLFMPEGSAAFIDKFLDSIKQEDMPPEFAKALEENWPELCGFKTNWQDKAPALPKGESTGMKEVPLDLPKWSEIAELEAEIAGLKARIDLLEADNAELKAYQAETLAAFESLSASMSKGWK